MHVSKQRAWHGPAVISGFLLLIVAIAMIAGQGSGNAAKPAAHAASQEVPWLTLTAGNIRPDLATVLYDQRQADQGHREAWIAAGHDSDLQTLADAAGQTGTGTSKLDADARRFSDDASAYLTAAGPAHARLPAGWQDSYAQLRADLNALAADAGLSPVPAPGYPVSGVLVPANPPIPVQVPNANACTSATTVTNSSSDTGASSHSVKVKTTCGTNSTSVTNKHAVSAKGKVTNTTTTTTASGAGNSSGGSSDTSSGP